MEFALKYQSNMFFYFRCIPEKSIDKKNSDIPKKHNLGDIFGIVCPKLDNKNFL